MKRTMFIVCLLLLFLVAHVTAENTPTLWLNEGTNEVTFSVVNRRSEDLTGIAIHVDEEKLPEWLSIENDLRPIDIKQGQKSFEKIALTLNVSDAPVDVEAEMPFTFTDSKSGRWEYSVRVHVNTDLPSSYELFENYPNPFNPVTTIRYSLKEYIHAKLIIYNSLGQQVRTLVDSPRNAGVHSVKWDGKDDFGSPVSSGVYVYTLHAGGFAKTMKMLLVQ